MPPPWMSKTFLLGIVADEPAAERLQQLRHRHGRAFDVPARPAEHRDARRRRPARLARLGRLPQHEIHLVALVGGDVDAGAGEHLVERAARQRAVARPLHRVHRRGREQHMVLGDIGDADLHQPLDHVAHARRMCSVARGWKLGSRQPSAFTSFWNCALVSSVTRRIASLSGSRRIVAGRARVDLVVDVGDVAHIGDVLVAVEMPEQPEQHVEDDHRAGHCRYGRSRRPSVRRHTCVRSRHRSGRNPPSSASACCRAANPWSLQTKHCPGLLAWAFVLSCLKMRRKRPDQRLALANNANRANGEGRFHRRALWRARPGLRQASQDGCDCVTGCCQSATRSRYVAGLGVLPWRRMS